MGVLVTEENPVHRDGPVPVPFRPPPNARAHVEKVLIINI